MATLILFNKPYGVLSQFSTSDDCPTLAHYITQKDVYPAGRLDKDSEGLLLLTDSGQLQHWIAGEKNYRNEKKQSKQYWVQVEGEVTNTALASLRQGVILKDGPTLPAQVSVIDPPPIWPRNPPIRVRKNIPTQWLNIVLFEGRNRQVRRMTAAVGLPTLRLIRHQIADWTLDNLSPGEWRQLTIHVPDKQVKDVKSKSHPTSNAKAQTKSETPSGNKVRPSKQSINKGHDKRSRKRPDSERT